MNSKCNPLWLWIAYVLVTFELASAQYDDCAMLQESELGDTTALSSTGLLADALAIQSGDAPLMYQLLEFNTVCLGQGSVRDTYRTISLIVRFRDSGGTESTMQLHFQCGSGAWNIPADGFGSSANAVTAAGGTLTTALRTDCFLCLDPSLAPAGQVSVEEHCLGTVNTSPKPPSPTYFNAQAPARCLDSYTLFLFQ